VWYFFSSLELYERWKDMKNLFRRSDWISFHFCLSISRKSREQFFIGKNFKIQKSENREKSRRLDKFRRIPNPRIFWFHNTQTISNKKSLAWKKFFLIFFRHNFQIFLFEKFDEFLLSRRFLFQDEQIRAQNKPVLMLISGKGFNKCVSYLLS